MLFCAVSLPPTPFFTCCSAVVCFLCFLQAVLHFWLYVIGILLCFSFCFCFCLYKGFFFFGMLWVFCPLWRFFPLGRFFYLGSSGCLNKIVFFVFLVLYCSMLLLLLSILLACTWIPFANYKWNCHCMLAYGMIREYFFYTWCTREWCNRFGLTSNCRDSSINHMFRNTFPMRDN